MATPLSLSKNVKAHLRRHFLRLIKLPGLYNEAIGEAFINLIDQAFQNYRQWQDTRDEISYNDWANQLGSKLQLTLNQWIGKAGARAVNLLRYEQDKAEQWWYFLDHPEVPPDNNLAERSLRLAVTKRKGAWWFSLNGAV